jgi:hypothetical protein
MANPITVGITAGVAINRNRNRVSVRFQNTGTTILYFIRQFGHISVIPSPTNYEFLLQPGATAEMNESFIESRSTSQFNVVSSVVGGLLAILETVRT